MNANQPAGILASSPEMVETVQRRAHGGYHAPTSNILSNALRSVRGLPTQSPTQIPVVDSEPNMFERLFKARALKDARMFQGVPEGKRTVGDVVGTGILNAGIKTATTVPGIMSSLTPEGIEANRQERLRANEPLPTDTRATRLAKNISSSLENVPSPIEVVGAGIQGLTDAAQYAFGDTPYMPVTEGDPRYRPGTVPTASYGDDIVDDEYSTGAPQTPGETTAAEELAATTTPTQESAKKDAEEETSSSKPTTFTPILDAETIEGLTEGSLSAEDEGKLIQGTGNAVIDQALSILQGETGAKTESQKAKAMDETLNIQGTRKERIEKRKEVLKELLGDRAKDIRTDANYNLMMTGLMIAAGESPDVLTNVVKGLAVGLKGYAEAVGDEAQAVTKEDRGLMMQAASEVGAEISSEKAAALKAEQARVTRQHEERMQDKRLATSLVSTQLQVGSREALALAQIASREKLAGNAFEQNVALFELKANQEEKIFDMKADLQRELSNPDTETIKLMKAVQEEAKADGDEMSDLEALIAVKQAGATTGKSTDTTNSYNRLVSAGMSTMDAWLLSNQTAVTELIKDMGSEDFENFLMGKLAQGGQQAPQQISTDQHIAANAAAKKAGQSTYTIGTGKNAQTFTVQ